MPDSWYFKYFTREIPIQNKSFQQINNSSRVRHFHNEDKQGMYPLLLKSPVSTDPPDPLMIHPLSIHLATLEAALLKPPVNPTLLHIATCRLSTRIRGVGPFRPRDFYLESRRTSWTSGTRLTELIISGINTAAVWAAMC